MRNLPSSKRLDDSGVDLRMKSEDQKLTLLGFLAVVAIIVLVFFFRSTFTGQTQYHLPLYEQEAVYVPNYNHCAPVQCPGYDFEPGGEAVMIGTEELTGNLYCQCPDESVYIIRSDRIE